MDTLISFGGAVKALGAGRFEAPLVLFGDPEKKDLVGDFFTADTDFWIDFPARLPLLYAHGQDASLKYKRLGGGGGKAEVSLTEAGVWMQGQLDLADDYERSIYALIEAGKMGTSSGAVAHCVEREKAGEGAFFVKSWYLAEASLTPTPCEPRNRGSVIPLKSLPDLYRDGQITTEDAEALLADGDSFDARSAKVADAVADFAPAARARFETRVKSGRRLSAATRERIKRIIDAAADLSALYDESAPPELAADDSPTAAALQGHHQRLQARRIALSL